MTSRPRPARLVLLGHPVAHSLSPRFQNAALRSAGIPVTYEALDTPSDRLGATLAALRREGAGGNVTIPHKEAVRLACDHVSDVARRAGAVNTFWVEGSELHGDNTDVPGFERAVTALLGESQRARRVALLGAGGAARAVLTAVERWPGATVALHARGRSRAERLAAEFPVVHEVSASAADAAADADLVINASPIGMLDEEVPLAPALLPARTAVLDLVYRRGETAWVRAARDTGHRAADGRTMLVEQGAVAFERWFGIVPDRAAMYAVIG